MPQSAKRWPHVTNNNEVGEQAIAIAKEIASRAPLAVQVSNA